MLESENTMSTHLKEANREREIVRLPKCYNNINNIKCSLGKSYTSKVKLSFPRC